MQDKKDLSSEFEDERQRLNECIRNMEGNLSFYKQIAEKFLSESDLAALKDSSNFDYEKREFIIPPFLLHDEKLTLPKTLKRNEVDDLWKEKRKGAKLQLLNEPLPDMKSNLSVSLDNLPESKSSVFSRTYKESSVSPLLQNRRILKMINPDDERYKEKEYGIESTARETFFRRTNFRISENSRSTDKRPPSSSNRLNSRTKLESLSGVGPKVETSQDRRPVSKGREKLEPIVKK